MLIALGPVGRDQMIDQPSLVLIQTASAGYENVDIDAASELGIWVSHAPSGDTGNAASVAEFAILLMLAASRRLSTFLKPDGKPRTQTSRALSGKTVCIVGLGEIGKRIVELLRPFGVKIVGTTRHPEDAPADVTIYSPGNLQQALADADYVVLCVPSSKENENLLNAAMFHAMKQGAILVNIARGALVDERALLDAIEDGRISAAGLDVVKEEPLVLSNPLLQFPQLIVTPHIAGLTDLTLHGTIDYVCQVVDEVAAGKKPRSVLNAPTTPRGHLRA
jgi:phosphoglycerate dehydrogenase-like enzyme